MAQFTGFTCDDCGNVVATSERVKKVTRFEADEVAHTGEEKMDLCPDCAVAHMGALEVQPLRRRGKGKEEVSETPEQPEDEPDEGSGELQGILDEAFSEASQPLPS